MQQQRISPVPTCTDDTLGGSAVVIAALRSFFVRFLAIQSASLSMQKETVGRL